MASIATDAAGRRRILFAGKDGGRKTLYLGDTPMKMAQGVLFRVEQLISANLTGHPVDDATNRWLASLDDRFTDKLAAVGLIPKRASAMLANFVDAYIGSRTDAKPNTIKNFKVARSKDSSNPSCATSEKPLVQQRCATCCPSLRDRM